MKYDVRIRSLSNRHGSKFTVLSMHEVSSPVLINPANAKEKRPIYASREILLINYL